MKTISIKATQTTKDTEYYRVEYRGKVLGAYWLTSNGNWLVQSWGGSSLETETASSKTEAIALIEKSWKLSQNGDKF